MILYKTMPKAAIDYSKCVIYKIVCNDLDVKDVYVGHTTDFRKRKSEHKTNCNNENGKKYNFKVYSVVRENGGWSNWSIIEIEKYSCNDSNEARSRERYFYECLNANLNSQRPIETKTDISLNKKEYYEVHRDEILLKRQEYRQLNLDKLTEYKKKYNATHKDELSKKCECECGKIYQHCKKSKHMKTKFHRSFIESKK
jgi:hypothetical protein